MPLELKDFWLMKSRINSQDVVVRSLGQELSTTCQGWTSHNPKITYRSWKFNIRIEPRQRKDLDGNAYLKMDSEELFPGENCNHFVTTTSKNYLTKPNKKQRLKKPGNPEWIRGKPLLLRLFPYCEIGSKTDWKSLSRRFDSVSRHQNLSKRPDVNLHQDSTFWWSQQRFLCRGNIVCPHSKIGLCCLICQFF